MRKFPGIPEPAANLDALLNTAQSTKAALETILGQRRGSRRDSAVTWADLVALGIVEEAQVPRD